MNTVKACDKRIAQIEGQIAALRAAHNARIEGLETVVARRRAEYEQAKARTAALKAVRA